MAKVLYQNCPTPRPMDRPISFLSGEVEKSAAFYPRQMLTPTTTSSDDDVVACLQNEKTEQLM